MPRRPTSPSCGPLRVVALAASVSLIAGCGAGSPQRADAPAAPTGTIVAADAAGAAGAATASSQADLAARDAADREADAAWRAAARAVREQAAKQAERRAARQAQRAAQLIEEKAEEQAARRARKRAEAAAALAASNPLAGRPWGVYQGPREPTSAPYEQASGATREALAKIALQPKAAWFGAWISDDDIGAQVADYIAGTQQGDPDALVQMTIFRMVPWEHDACQRLPTAAEQTSYRRWIDSFAAAVGATPTAIVLQPDGPFALCAPGGPAVPASLVSYATRVLSALPETSVYIEVGAGDWPAEGQGGVAEVMRFLLPAGIEEARGIALNGTHYSGTEQEVARGTAIVEELAARGITEKHFVVNTSSNGNPFVFGSYTGPDPDDAFVCRSPADHSTCVTLGIPPTTEVADPAWGLSEQARAGATAYADGYLWFGRPWLYRQNSPFVLQRALDLARSTPY